MIHLSQDENQKIISSLKAGLVVGLPTETVYGLAISLNSASALEKLIYLKRREINSGKVFTLVPRNVSDINSYALLNRESSLLIKKYFPGELTLILKKNPSFHHPYFDHFASIGIRIPKHPLFYQILEETGPLLLTSANKRGKTPALDSETLEKEMPNLDAIVDGKSGNHSPSTIISFIENPPKIIREGDLKIDL